MRKSEELYRRILRDFPNGGVALFDRDLRYLLVEGSALSRIGVSKQDLEGKTIWEALPAETCAAIEPPYRAALAGEEVSFEAAYAGRLFSVHARPLPDADGGISRGIAVFLDTTDSKRSAEEISRLNRELQANVARLGVLNAELEAFSYSVSHDLRAPVRHINGFVDLLRRSAGAGLSADSQSHLETISGAAHRMGQLIDNLLAFSRMGRVELLSRPVDLSGLVAAVIDEQRGELQGREVDFQADSLPEVNGDASILRVVFTNLVSNAVKYSRPRARPRVEIGSRPGENGELVIFVRDNGVGFDMRYADKLFGVFERLHRSTEFEGTGIGLATVRRIVQRHGGRCWAEGVVDGGATFYISLPATPRGEA
jgi:PAS domain S-box-containing protein